MDKMFVIEGLQLNELLRELKMTEVSLGGVYKLRIGMDDSNHFKYKINEHCWSPPVGKIQEPY